MLLDQLLLTIATYGLLIVCQIVSSVCLFWFDHKGISTDIWCEDRNGVEATLQVMMLLLYCSNNC